MSMSNTEILLDRSQAGIGIITLNGAERLNALSQSAVRQLRTTLHEIASDEALRVIILTGAGRGFCAGWDLTSPLLDAEGQPLADPPGVSDYYRGQELFAGMVRAVRAMDKVVISAVNGAAVGAGFALTLASDVRLASSNASFHVGAVRIGLTAGECGISYHLPRLIGASRAFEVMLTGRPIKAEEALGIGLVADVVPPEQLMERALQTARQVLGNSPYATRHTKRVMWANLDANLDAALEQENRAQVLALMTEDFREASAAFVEKRPPHFTGR